MERETTAVLCPYDKNHIIHKSRLQRHLIRCSRNFIPNQLEKCPFNATHLIKPAELAFHIEQCPDRKYIDSERCRLEVKKHGALRPCPPSKAESCHDIYSDLWEDSDVQSFGTTDVSVVSDSFTNVTRNDDTSREPYGCSEAIMLEFPEDSHYEDAESVTSIMAVGRGRFILQNRRCNELSRVGKGRGLCSPEMLRAGASATTDVEDTGSVTSNMAVGRGKFMSQNKRCNELSRVGKGRGLCSPEKLRVGESATTDIEDAESVTSSIGRSGINYPQYLRNPEKANRDPFLAYIEKLPGK